MEQLDLEMIKNLELLLDFDAAEQEDSWTTLDHLEEAEKENLENNSNEETKK